MNVAANEPVTSPDQHKPTNLRLARIGGVGSIVILLLLTLGNHQGWVENVWLVAIAGLIALMMVADWVLRRNGLRS